MMQTWATKDEVRLYDSSSLANLPRIAICAEASDKDRPLQIAIQVN